MEQKVERSSVRKNAHVLGKWKIVKPYQGCSGTRQGLSSTQNNFRTQDKVECRNMFLSAGNTPEIF